jgi:hypothetical protein
MTARDGAGLHSRAKQQQIQPGVILSSYELQKLIRNINRDPSVRRAFFETPDQVIARHGLTDEEKASLLARDYGALYRLGVHGLLLRPFSILHSVSEKDYLEAIRKGPDQ